MLTSKEKMKAIMKAKKLCRLSESSLNDEYKKIRKELQDINTNKKRKEWLGVVVNIIGEHFEKLDENAANQTIPDLDY